MVKINDITNIVLNKQSRKREISFYAMLKKSLVAEAQRDAPEPDELTEEMKNILIKYAQKLQAAKVPCPQFCKLTSTKPL